MAPEWFRPKTVIPIAVVFVALGFVLIRLSENQDTQNVPEEQLQLSRIQIKQGNQLVDISPGVQLTDAEMAQLLRGRIQVLASPDTADRRAVAIQLAHMTGDPAERERLRPLGAPLLDELRTALFKGLNDPDPVVSANCRDALIGLWRICGSDTASEAFGQGIAEFDAGNLAKALTTFQGVEALGGPVPPDLYRMTAEIYLARNQTDKALAECAKAVKAEPRSFPTLLVLARLYHGLGDDKKALEAIKGALSIYHIDPEALKLRDEIAPKQPSAAPAATPATPGS